MSVNACNDSLNAKTLNVKSVSAMCDKCVLIDKHAMCVLNSVAKPIKRTVASESNQKPRNFTRKIYERVSVPLCQILHSLLILLQLVEIILFIVDSGCSKHITGNLKLLINFVEKFMGTVKFRNDQIEPILGYGDLVQGAVTIKRVYYVEGLNHNLFSVDQFCDADLEVAFRKSTCYIRDLKGNELITGSRGMDLYSITLQDINCPNLICLMVKASSSQAWLWHHCFSHLNFDTINLLSKNDIVFGLPKLKFIKDHLCSSCELGKAKRNAASIGERPGEACCCSGIIDCSSCGALYTIDYCCSYGSLVHKIICDLNKAPDSPHHHTFSSNQRHFFHCKDVLGDGEFCQRCTCMSPSHINHHCYYECGDPLDDIFCKRCTCNSCGKGAHIGYNCPPKVSVISNPEPCKSQTIDELPQTVPSFHPTCYSGDESPFTCDSTPNIVDDSRTVFNLPPQPPKYSYEFYGNDAYYGYDRPPQNSCYNSNSFGFDIFLPQQLPVIDQNPLEESMKNLRIAFQAWSENIQQKNEEEEKQIADEQAAKARYWKIPICHDDDEDYTIAITPKEPDNFLNIGDKHLDTISVTKSDEFIKSSVENLVPNPSESKGEHECDVPACDDLTTFSNILFDDDYDFSSSEDESFSDEDISKKIYSNPLFDEEIISMKIDPHHFNDESDLIESMLNQDSSIISSSSKIDSLLDEFAGKLILLKSIPPGIDKADCDPKEEIRLVERLLYDNSSPRPPKEFNSENSDVIIESFSPSPIPVEDNDPFMEEIDLFLDFDGSIPPGIDNDYSDSKGDNLFLERLLHDDHIPLPDTLDFSNVVRVFLSFFTYPVTSLILLSSESEDTIFNPGISNYHFSSLEPGVSHRSGTFMKFNIYPNHLNESLIEILSSTCFPMDQ
nr:integrase, catalytic region, zinc finger, CCHC-type, peptidase aspartic, catalytic [Tanacetum cinerariifolium]